MYKDHQTEDNRHFSLFTNISNEDILYNVMFIASY
jgi:hypothetical protein